MPNNADLTARWGQPETVSSRQVSGGGWQVWEPALLKGVVGGQGRQVDGEVAPGVAEYVEEGQGVHV